MANLRKLRPEHKPDGHHQYQYITGCLYNNDITDNYFEECPAIRATDVHLKHDIYDNDMVAAIHGNDKGLRSMVWFREPVRMK